VDLLFSADWLTVTAIIGLALWSVAEWTIHILGLRQPGGANREWPSSVGIVLAFVLLAVYSALDATTLRGTTLAPGHVPLRVAGLLVLAGGFAIRIVARAHLGRHFSGFVQTNDAHRLVASGVYRYVRHPAYLGSLLIFLGFPLALGSIGGVAIALLLGVPAIVYRIHVEEHALLQWFGDEYTAYRARTARLIPRVW
jgi:protein-S-isoprenylcysteine O-methyltransferase Ste14